MGLEKIRELVPTRIQFLLAVGRGKLALVPFLSVITTPYLPLLVFLLSV
jgi:hypothetical protein